MMLFLWEGGGGGGQTYLFIGMVSRKLSQPKTLRYCDDLYSRREIFDCAYAITKYSSKEAEIHCPSMGMAIQEVHPLTAKN